MKRLFTLICIMALSLPVFGQRQRSNLEQRSADFDDLLALVNAAGFELFCFDITDGKIVEFVVQEHLDNQIIWQSISHFGSAGQDVSSFDKVNIGFYPSPGNDSIKFVHFSVPGEDIHHNVPLKLKKNLNGEDFNRDGIQRQRFYCVRPDVSYRYSDENGFVRLAILDSGIETRKSLFGGESTSAEPKNIPHHCFVIGVNVK